MTAKCRSRNPQKYDKSKMRRVFDRHMAAGQEGENKVEMTRKRLEIYRSEKQEIEELRQKLKSLSPDAYTGHDTILDYRTGFPVPYAVVGTDIQTYWVRKNSLEKEIVCLEQRCQEVEQWVEEIPDSKIRRMFRLYYIDGNNQKNVAKQLFMDRSTISKKINNYLQITEK